MPKATPVTIEIAGLCVTIDCQHRKLAAMLQERYRNFLAKAGQIPDFHAKIRWTDTEGINTLRETSPCFNNGQLQIESPGCSGFVDIAKQNGQLTFSSGQPVEEIDYYLRMVYALLAHEKGGVLLHAAGVKTDSGAYLFLGPSGAGKTTVCKHSQAQYTILNDDLILLLPCEKRWQAYSTPFWNPTQVRPSTENAPVTALFWLVQSKQALTRPMRAGQALAALTAGAPIVSVDPGRIPRLLKILSAIQATTPMQALHFLPDPSFWEVIDA